jgi:integrase
MPKRAIRLADAIEMYLVARRQARKSPATIIAERQVLNGFLRSVGNLYLTQIGAAEVRRYFNDMEHLAGSTYNVYRARISKFFQWACRDGYSRVETPLALVGAVPEVKPKKLFLTEDQAMSAIETAHSPLDRAVLVVALATGARRGELKMLRIGDLDFGQFAITKHMTKGGAEDDVLSFSDFVAGELMDWFTYYAAHLQEPISPEELLRHPDWFLLPGHSNVATHLWVDGSKRRIVCYPTQPIGEPIVVVKRAMTAIGIPAEKQHRQGIHVTRRTAGDMARRKSGSIRTAKALLGHKTEATTEKYLDAEEDKRARNAYLRNGGWLTGRPAGGGTVIPLRREG